MTATGGGVLERRRVFCERAHVVATATAAVAELGAWTAQQLLDVRGIGAATSAGRAASARPRRPGARHRRGHVGRARGEVANETAAGTVFAGRGRVLSDRAHVAVAVCARPWTQPTPPPLDVGGIGAATSAGRAARLRT